MASNIKVAVRPRPLDESKKEKWAAGFEIHGRRITLGPKTFDPDITMSPSITQEEVYEYCFPIIESVKDGFNGTIMVYGQTGTGKTHTMLGDENVTGIAFQAIRELLNFTREKTMLGRNVALTLSMLEIYNEKITDMLSGSQNEVQLIGGFPRSTTKVTLTGHGTAQTIIREGLMRRHIASTAINDRSSRSHVILMLDLEEVLAESTEVAHLFLVDLAGSENIKKSNVVGKAAGEAGMINRSLLALKNVILTLSNTSEGAKPHVPYRDSRLTEILQDSIGGSARTMLIACVSPVGRDVEETKSTLEYASKARTIRNISNTDRDRMSIKLRSLEVEVQKLKNKLQTQLSDKGGVWVSKDEAEEMAYAKEELEEHKQWVTALQDDKKALEARQHVSQAAVEMLKAMITERDEAVDAKEQELQRFKIDYLTALNRFKETAAALEERSSAQFSQLNDVVEASYKDMGTRTRNWVKATFDRDSAVASHAEQIGRTVAEVNSSIQESFEKMANLNAELAKDVEEIRAKKMRRVEVLRADLLEVVGQIVDRAEQDLQTCANDEVNRITLHRELCSANFERRSTPLIPASLVNLVESVNASHQHAAANLPKAEVSEEVKCLFAEGMSGSIFNVNGLFAESLPAVSNVETPGDSRSSQTAKPTREKENLQSGATRKRSRTTTGLENRKPNKLST